MQCQKCGNQLAPDAVFCSKCGNQMGNGGSYSFGANLCPKCGNTLESGARFCAICGYNVDGDVKEVKTEPIMSAPVYREAKKKDSGLIVLISVLSVVILVCGVALALIFMGDSSDGNSEIANVIEETEKAIPKKKNKDSKAEYDPKTYKYDDEADKKSYYSDYLFESDKRYITERDLRYCSQDEIALIRNEIYARHGYIFQKDPYKSYFAAKSWYIPNPNFSEALFNSIEKYNKDFIVEYEKRMGWRN